MVLYLWPVLTIILGWALTSTAATYTFHTMDVPFPDAGFTVVTGISTPGEVPRRLQRHEPKQSRFCAHPRRPLSDPPQRDASGCERRRHYGVVYHARLSPGWRRHHGGLSLP